MKELGFIKKFNPFTNLHYNKILDAETILHVFPNGEKLRNFLKITPLQSQNGKSSFLTSKQFDSLRHVASL